MHPFAETKYQVISTAFALILVACGAAPSMSDSAPEQVESASTAAPLDVAAPGEPAFFAGSLNGANEVPNGAAAGDEDRRAIAFMEIRGNDVSFAIEFRGIEGLTAGHLHQGAKGTNGPVKIPFFTTPVPCGQTSVSGTVRVDDPQLLDDIRSNPGNFYFNLHTEPFPDGAVRGQVHALSSAIDMKRALKQNFRASVIRGAQIYACTVQADGTFAFTQDNVRATLEGGISHFFVNPGPAGPPEWRARDGSAVTGRVTARIPNGAGNIAELHLAATQVGESRGRLAGIDEILRLNTVGGVAPSGSCDPIKQPTHAAPYQADYVFIDATGPHSDP
ncbi:CHRD domain-containing protein [Pendulispora rubella]|uniref:CHRD domain-containing protein n=1 Tax=Pendulispora rubella TaxID=2741070 RepID=A0ABZ2L6W3_9BACT